MNTMFAHSLTAEQQRQWSDFVQSSDHAHPRQHASMSEIEAAKGRTPIFAMGLADDQPVAAGLFSIRPLWFGGRFSLEAICLSGPVFNDPVFLRPFLEQTIDYFGRIGVGRISVTPYWFYPEAEAVRGIFMETGFRPRREPIPTGLIDLGRSEEEMLAALSKNARKKLRRLEDHPIKVYALTRLEDAQPLYRCLTRMREERLVLPMSQNEFKGFFEWGLAYPQLGCCLRADYEQTFIAGQFLKYGTRYAHGLAYAINTEAQAALPKISLGFSLWWQGLLWVKRSGSRYFDVDVYEENVDPSHPLYAVYQFKKQFKPVPINRIEPLCYDYTSPLCVLLKSVVIVQKIQARIKSAVCKMKSRPAGRFQDGSVPPSSIND